MGTLAARPLDRAGGQVIPKADLLRLEGLGDNCELGFVLRRMGFEDGMLFRWASVRPESLLATLRGDFADLYEFDNLVPQNTKMVRDLKYGTAWHTQMYSALQERTLTFTATEERRREIHAREAAKLGYLVEKLRRKFEHPNPVFVIKANNGIPDDLLEAIHYQIYRHAASPRFLLLEVRADPALAGTVEVLDRNRVRGHVTAFAGYDSADAGDDANWTKILVRALALNALEKATSAQTAPERTPGNVVLRFPSEARPDLSMPIAGDLRAGMPYLVGGNAWCRMIDDDVYRMHATESAESATRLRWTGVFLPPDYKLQLRAACAIEESMPVCATLKVTDANGVTVRSRHLFRRTEPDLMSLAIPPVMQNPLTVDFAAEPPRALKAGDRAVIDVAPVQAVPRA